MNTDGHQVGHKIMADKMLVCSHIHAVTPITSVSWNISKGYTGENEVEFSSTQKSNAKCASVLIFGLYNFRSHAFRSKYAFLYILFSFFLFINIYSFSLSHFCTQSHLSWWLPIQILKVGHSRLCCKDII